MCTIYVRVLEKFLFLIENMQCTVVILESRPHQVP
jgi:hypothetical protein